MTTVFKAGHTAVITGGASGIGLALAKKCHSHGMKVLVVDRDEQALSTLDQNAGAKIASFKMDVARPEDWARLKEKVQQDFGGQVNLLALNAGVGPKSNWDDVAPFHAILDTNVYGVVNGLHTLLPRVLQQQSSPAAIIITGSKQGITNPPGNVAYNMSKAAVKTAAEHLSWELRDNKSVSVHLLVPGWTFTGLTGRQPGAAEKPSGAWTPEQVIDFLAKKMAEGQFYIICPDNEVSEQLDRKRMLWGAGDAVEGRPPLSRWREDWKVKAKEWIEGKGT